MGTHLERDERDERENLSLNCAAVRGRRRDAAIDARILAAARRQLSCLGYEGMSLAAVAEEACTTRQALYRRWPDKAQLAAEAIAVTVPLDALRVSSDPRADLERELDDFQRAMTAPSHASLAGTMLQDATDPRSREQYRLHVIAPRLERIRAILEHARDMGLLATDADIEIALTLPTGGWYERQLACLDAPDDWSSRTAGLVWRALGGQAAGHDLPVQP
jgi:AcrR family transcriptional regulator